MSGKVCCSSLLHALSISNGELKISLLYKAHEDMQLNGMALEYYLFCGSQEIIEDFHEHTHLTSRQSRPADVCPFCDCVCIDEMGHCEGCGKLTVPPPA